MEDPKRLASLTLASSTQKEIAELRAPGINALRQQTLRRTATPAVTLEVTQDPGDPPAPLPSPRALEAVLRAGPAAPAAAIAAAAAAAVGHSSPAAAPSFSSATTASLVGGGGRSSLSSLQASSSPAPRVPAAVDAPFASPLLPVPTSPPSAPLAPTPLPSSAASRSSDASSSSATTALLASPLLCALGSSSASSTTSSAAVRLLPVTVTPAAAPRQSAGARTEDIEALETDSPDDSSTDGSASGSDEGQEKQRSDNRGARDSDGEKEWRRTVLEGQPQPPGTAARALRARRSAVSYAEPSLKARTACCALALRVP